MHQIFLTNSIKLSLTKSFFSDSPILAAKWVTLTRTKSACPRRWQRRISTRRWRPSLRVRSFPDWRNLSWRQSGSKKEVILIFLFLRYFAINFQTERWSLFNTVSETLALMFCLPRNSNEFSCFSFIRFNDRKIQYGRTRFSLESLQEIGDGGTAHLGRQ